MKISLWTLLILISCHHGNDSISDSRLEIIDSLSQEIMKQDSQIDQILFLLSDVCISSKSNVLKLGEEYRAEICNRAIPIKNNFYKKRYFVVIDSLGGMALNDTIQINNKHFFFNYKTKKKGIHRIKGRLIDDYGRGIDELAFETNFTVD